MTVAEAACARIVWLARPIRGEAVGERRGRHCEPAAEGDRARAARIRHPDAATRFVEGRAVLRETIRLVRADVDDGCLEIRVERSGRPCLVGRPEIGLSLAHTRGLAVAAVSSTGPVGIDVEPIRRRGVPAVGAWLTTQEQRALAALPPADRDERLLHLWVGKEAALKAHHGVEPVGRLDIEVSGGWRGSDLDGVPSVAPRSAGHVVEAAPDAAVIGEGAAHVGWQTGPSTSERAQRALLWYLVGGRFLVAVAS